MTIFRKYSKELKQELLKRNFNKVEWVDGVWEITSKTGNIITVGTSKATHQYGKDMYYRIVHFYDTVDRRQYTFTLHRFIYCWFNGDIEEGMDIHHIDGDTDNNRLENLEKITHAENIRKRGIGRNQYSYNLTDEEILEKRRQRASKKQNKNC